MRRTRLGVSNFIACGDEFLFIKRSLAREDDPGKVNAVGGKVELGETMLEAVIRETREETGLEVSAEAVRFIGVLRIEGRESYADDWVHFLFKTDVLTLTLPNGNETEEGELLWIPKDKIFGGEYDVVDDLQYYFQKIIENNNVLFLNMIMAEKQKVESVTESFLTRK